MKGRFIVFEGPDGVGKSTMIAQIKQRLSAEGYPVKVYSEPVDLYTFTRAIESVDKVHQLIGYVHSRFYNLFYRVTPALETGHIVLQDRYYPSTLVYQPLINLRYMQDIMETALPEPDILFLLHDMPDRIYRRIKSTHNLSEGEISQLLTRYNVVYNRIRYPKMRVRLEDVEIVFNRIMEMME